MPAVTVVVPAHNAMPHLQIAVESIQNQSFSDLRLIVVNDGSTDSSVEYLDSLDDRRVTIVNQANRGPSFAFNRGLEMCRTDLVARMDADDVSEVTRIEEQVGLLKRRSNVGLLGTQFRPLGSRRIGRASRLPTQHDAINRALMAGHHAICNPTIMCRTELLLEVGGYRADGVLEDWSMFLRMGARARLANIDRPLLQYRIHEGSTNTKHMAELRSRIDFVCDRARRTANGEPEINYAEFLIRRQRGSGPRRFADACGVRAMVLYRKAQAQILGDSPVRGFALLAVAAALSPSTTFDRLTRGLRDRLSRSHTVS